MSETWLGVAWSWAAIDLRMGSTRPIPMNAMTHANATAQTARGCLSMLLLRDSWFGSVVTEQVGQDGHGRGELLLGATGRLDPLGHERGVATAYGDELLAALRRHRDECRAGVVRMRLTLEPALLDQPVDQAGHGGLAAPVGLG